MKPNPLKRGILIENSAGVGTVTRKMVRERAVQLAVIDGYSEGEVSKANWEQAKRELTGGTDADPKEDMIESAPESERWNPLPGSTGHKVEAALGEDEDEQGRSDNERLVEEGISEAEHAQMLQGARESAKNDEGGDASFKFRSSERKNES